MRSKASELAGRRPEPGLLLLADLRHLHRVAAGVSLDWELLGAKDSELLALTKVAITTGHAAERAASEGGELASNQA